jgi:hypothetical protein
MIQFKSCPRCQGDVHVNSDWYGEYQNCLQCGWSKDTSGDPLTRLMETRKSFADTASVRRAS